MVKPYFILFFYLISFHATADDQRIIRASAKVNRLIETRLNQLGETEKSLVLDGLTDILRVFNETTDGDENQTGSNIYACKSGNNTLHNLITGAIIHDFGNIANCQEAMENLKQGKFFCDYGNNQLFNLNGTLAHDFGNADNCREAIESEKRVGRFCDYGNNRLFDSNGNLIIDFSNAQDCRNAL